MLELGSKGINYASTVIMQTAIKVSLDLITIATNKCTFLQSILLYYLINECLVQELLLLLLIEIPMLTSKICNV